MTTQTFQANASVAINGISHTLLRKVEKDIWQLEETSNKRIHEYKHNELLKMYGKTLDFLPAPRSSTAGLPTLEDQFLVHVAPEHFDFAKVRRTYAKDVLNIAATKEVMNPVITETWKRLGVPATRPHFTTVCRWRKKFLEDGASIRRLIDQVHRRGNRKSRYPEEVLRIANEAITTQFMTKERKTIQDTLDYAELAVSRENKLRLPSDQLPLPSRRLLTSLIGAVPAFDKHAARYGREAAIKMFRSVQAHRTTMRPLERAEIDHTPLDMMVIDDFTGLPLGRPWLTVCIDDFTRCVLGIHISFSAPSYLTVAKCLQHAFMPKTNLHDEYPSVVNSWDAYGVMQELVVDNGAEFHSDGLENACLLLGTEIHYSARKTPWFKGKVERFQGSLNRGAVHGHPGTTFSNIFEKGDYDPKKHAVIRLSKLKEVVHIWIADAYHQKPHRALKIAPKDAWRNGIPPEDIRLPENPLLMEAIVGKSTIRSLSHKGIEKNSLYYNSVELAQLRRTHGDKFDVEIRFNPEDIGSVVVVSPDKKQLVKVPAINAEYADGLTEWQHVLCQKYAARELKKYDSIGWLEAKEKIGQIFDAEIANTKKLKRKNSAKPKPKVQPEVHPSTNMAKDVPYTPTVSTISPPSKALPDVSIHPAGAVKSPKRFAPVLEQRNRSEINEQD